MGWLRANVPEIGARVVEEEVACLKLIVCSDCVVQKVQTEMCIQMISVVSSMCQLLGLDACFDFGTCL